MPTFGLEYSIITLDLTKINIFTTSWTLHDPYICQKLCQPLRIRKKNWLNPMSYWVYRLIGKISLGFFIKGITSYGSKQPMRTWYKWIQGNQKECSNNHCHLSSQTLIHYWLYSPGQKYIFLSFSGRKGSFIHILKDKSFIQWLWAQPLFPLYFCSLTISYYPLPMSSTLLIQTF